MDKLAPATPEVDLLLAVMQDLSMAGNRSEIQTLVAGAARKLAHSDGASFVLREGDLCHYVAEDAVAPLWRGKRFPMAHCLSGWVMLNRKPAIIPDIQMDDRVLAQAYLPTFVQSMAMVPIRRLDPIGAIGFYWDRHHEVGETELRLFTILADAVSLAIERLRVLEELERLESEIGAKSGLEPELRTLVRMCSWTGRVDVDGQWISIDDYLKRTFGIQISHGMSPEGAKSLGHWLDTPDDENAA
jgi:GAF domain-containing protein